MFKLSHRRKKTRENCTNVQCVYNREQLKFKRKRETDSCVPTSGFFLLLLNSVRHTQCTNTYICVYWCGILCFTIAKIDYMTACNTHWKWMQRFAFQPKRCNILHSGVNFLHCSFDWNGFRAKMSCRLPTQSTAFSIRLNPSAEI